MHRINPHTVIGLDGTAKNIKAITRFPTVSVVKEKAKKPDPRLFIIGGLTKVETSSNIHQIKLITSRIAVMMCNARTLQRLYGDTYK